MKIKKLSIHNIASVEDATIDFAGAILGSEPLFLITGETGSGKTTILNAICLALYNTAPNIEGVQNASSAAKVGGLSINAPMQLMRRGTYDASVELVFDGNDGHEYVARWVGHRASNGNPQPEKVSLFCQHSQLSLQKKREVADAIESANVVGLTYEQFCRTTMLAQGQFSKFMSSKDDEKSDILEKLTGTELYARIGRKVNERYKSASEMLTAIDNRIAGAKLLSPEERKALEENVGQLTREIDEEQRRLEEIKRKYEWQKAAETARGSRLSMMDKHGMMKSQLEDERIREHGATVALWDKTSDIRTTLTGMRDKTAQFSASEGRLKEKQTEFVSFVAGLEYVKKALADADGVLVSLKAQQEAESKHAEMYANSQRIETLIDSILSKRQEAGRQEARVAAAEKEQQAQDEPLAMAAKAEREAQEAFEQAHKVVEVKRTEAKEVKIETLRMAVTEREDMGNQVKACIDAMSNLSKKMQVKVDAVKTLTELREQIVAANQKKMEQEALLPEARREAEALGNQYKGKMDLRSHLVELQSRFHDTGTCPLCGSAVHGIHSESILDEEVAKAKAAAEESVARQQAIEKLIREAETVLLTTRNPLDRAMKAADDATREEEEAKLSANGLLSQFRFKWDDEGIGIQLQKLRESCEEALTLARQQLAEGQAKLDAIEPARKEEDSKRAAYDAAKARHEQIKEGVKAIENRIREAKTLRQQALDDAHNAFAALTPLLSIEADLQNANLVRLKGDIMDKAKAFAQNAEQILACQQKMHELNTIIGNVAPAIAELSGVLDVKAEASAKELKELETKLRTFHVEVTELNASINTLKSQLMAERETADAFFHAHPDMARDAVEALLGIRNEVIQDYRDEKRRIEDEIKQIEGAIRQIETQLEELNRHKPELQEEETLPVLEAAMVEKENLVKRLNDQKVEGQTRLNDNEERAKAQAGDILERERMLHLTNNWKLLNNSFGGTEGERFKRIAQSYVLRSLLHKANYYLRMLNSRYELTCTDSSLSISTLDLAQGGAERNVSLLSGGEGFVVSLALALGLSAISKEKINVDTLFIDEGFGTLSEDYLETVINTLDRLHQLGGRRVGIISHVAELAHRIPTQIQLKRTGPSSSRIEVVSL